MSLNFFDDKCQESSNSNEIFGLCDDKNDEKSYTNIINPEKWIATVRNVRKLNIVFTAIDKCIINENILPGMKSCDCMLTTSEHLYFVELKNQRSRWISDAIVQIESTINLFIENHDINQFKHKKAFACNKRHKHFQEIDNEFNLQFFRKHKFRIDVQADIVIF